MYLRSTWQRPSSKPVSPPVKGLFFQEGSRRKVKTGILWKTYLCREANRHVYPDWSFTGDEWGLEKDTRSDQLTFDKREAVEEFSLTVSYSINLNQSV